MGKPVNPEAEAKFSLNFGKDTRERLLKIATKVSKQSGVACTLTAVAQSALDKGLDSLEKSLEK